MQKTKDRNFYKTQFRPLYFICDSEQRIKAAGYAFLTIALVLFAGGSAAPAQELRRISGITEPIVDVTLSTDITGKISKIYHKEGDRVKKGAPLFSLDSRLEALEVKRRKLIMDNKAELVSAVEREKTLAAILESTRSLFEKTKSVSKDELDKLILEHTLAKSEISRLKSAELRERIEYKIAKASLNKRTIYAPAAGIVKELFIDEGEICETPAPVIHLVAPKTCFFVCNIDEKNGKDLNKGDMVELRINTGQSPVAKEAEIVFISPVVDSASSLVKVKARFKNQDHQIRPGASGFMILP